VADSYSAGRVPSQWSAAHSSFGDMLLLLTHMKGKGKGRGASEGKGKGKCKGKGKG
jgi:hypothetical protein